MQIKITNSLTKTKETFEPLVAGKVALYVCGPTVYNYIHIGNARPCIFFDVVVRFLRVLDYEVTHVMNFTDVDDKIIHKANLENSTCDIINQRYIEAFLNDMKLLGVTAPNFAPQVTLYIPQIISLIERLIKAGRAYVASDGEVFYSVRSFEGYGKLSGKNIDDLISGARVSPDEKKKDPLDFSLWKPKKTDEPLGWESPWCVGRPGWHIECSAMAMNLLGETFDIHGGGMDLTHPHHENEIAQSEGATNKQYVRYWMHSNMLSLGQEKMSKSLGNIILTKDFISLYGAETLRMLLLSAHYRSTIDFSVPGVRDIQTAIQRVYKTLSQVENILKGPLQETRNTKLEHDYNQLLSFSKSFRQLWMDSLADDFNTPKVFAEIFNAVRLINSLIDKKGFVKDQAIHILLQDLKIEIQRAGGVLGLFQQEPFETLEHMKNLFITGKNLSRTQIENWITERKVARSEKNYLRSDEIRDSLLSYGIELQDTGNTTAWDVIWSKA